MPQYDRISVERRRQTAPCGRGGTDGELSRARCLLDCGVRGEGRRRRWCGWGKANVVLVAVAAVLAMSEEVGAATGMQYMERGEVLEKDLGSLVCSSMGTTTLSSGCGLQGGGGAAQGKLTDDLVGSITEKNLFREELLDFEQTVVKYASDAGNIFAPLFTTMLDLAKGMETVVALSKKGDSSSNYTCAEGWKPTFSSYMEASNASAPARPRGEWCNLFAGAESLFLKMSSMGGMVPRVRYGTGEKSRPRQ
jgi:hypothetical protein